VAAVFPVIAVIFTGYLVSGIATPALPLHMHQDLGFGLSSSGGSPAASSVRGDFALHGRPPCRHMLGAKAK